MYYQPTYPQFGTGMGDLTQVLTGTAVQSGITVGGAAAGAAVAGASITGAIATAAVSAGIAAAGILIMTWLQSRRRNQMNKTNSSQIADEAERLLSQNLQAWQDSSKSVADKAQALENADLIYSWMRGPQGCGNPALGDPGRRCISERLTEGAVYDWYGWYIAPIAAAVPVQPNTTPPSTTTTLQPVTDPQTGETRYLPVEVTAGGTSAVAFDLPTDKLLFFGVVGIAAFLLMNGGTR